MRWVSLPEELSPHYLLELTHTSSSLQERYADLLERAAAGDLVGAIERALRAFEFAAASHDRCGRALALVFRADLLRRSMRWEDSLDAIRRALHWFETDVSPVARYNEAVAVYLEGVLHYMLRADEKAAATFAYAQSILMDSERHWAFENNTSRASDCRNVIRWLTQLSAFQEVEATDPVVMVMPVYELANRTLIRTDAIALPPIELMIPDEVVVRYCPPEILPLGLEASAFSFLRPNIQYAAIRIGDTVSIAREFKFGEIGKGDLLILEVTGGRPERGELVLTSDQPFVRSGDGRVTFHAAERTSGLGMQGTMPGLVGIPRVLIKDVEAE